jgi:hypothetical protein
MMNSTVKIITGLWGGDSIAWPFPGKKKVINYITVDGINRQLDKLPGRSGLIYAAIPDEDGKLRIKAFNSSAY